MNTTRLMALMLPPLLVLAGCAPSQHLLDPAAGPDDARFSPCPRAPRCAVSQADAGGETVPPLTAGADAQQAHAALLAALALNPDYTLLADDGRYVHTEYRTPTVGYRDDVEFLIRSDGTIDVRSSGRIGWYDWGANRRRIDALRAALAAVLPEISGAPEDPDKP